MSIEPRTILDLGCGTGRLGESLLDSSIEIDGITSNDVEAHRASRFYRNVWPYNLEDGLPDAVGTYDVIFMSHILEHVAYPEKLMRGVSNVLNPNGIVLCAIPNMLFLYNRIKLLLGKIEYKEFGIMDYTHLRWYTRLTLEKLFKKHGFAPESSAVTGNTPLGPLRKIVPEKIVNSLDDAIVQAFPGILAWEFLYCFRIERNK